MPNVVAAVMVLICAAGCVSTSPRSVTSACADADERAILSAVIDKVIPSFRSRGVTPRETYYDTGLQDIFPEKYLADQINGLFSAFDDQISWFDLHRANLQPVDLKCLARFGRLSVVDYRMRMRTEGAAVQAGEREWERARRHILISRPAFNADRRRAAVHVSTSCGALCGASTVFVVELLEGQWTVTKRHQYAVS